MRLSNDHWDVENTEAQRTQRAGEVIFGMTKPTKWFWNSRCESDNSISRKEENSCPTNLNSANNARR